jgi:hypothetical protein
LACPNQSFTNERSAPASKRCVAIECFKQGNFRFSRDKPDSFHAALAFKQKRFLVTKNAKDYMDDRKVPFHRMHGIIAVEGDMRDSDTYIGCLKTLLDIIIPFGEVYVKHKIQLKRDEINRPEFDSA